MWIYPHVIFFSQVLLDKSPSDCELIEVDKISEDESPFDVQKLTKKAANQPNEIQIICNADFVQIYALRCDSEDDEKTQQQFNQMATQVGELLQKRNLNYRTSLYEKTLSDMGANISLRNKSEGFEVFKDNVRKKQVAFLIAALMSWRRKKL